MFSKEDSHEDHKTHRLAQHEHAETDELGGSHGHDTHEHGQMTNGNSEEVVEHQSHEKGEFSTEHDISEHNPA